MKVTDKHILFWGEWLSNFYTSPFTDDRGIKFFCVEQYFMFEKAIKFKDHDTASQILRVKEPKEAKKLGRKVRGYDDTVWAECREKVMLDGLYFKFTQNKGLKKTLTQPEWKDKHFVEASPYDRIWGIGLGVDDPKADDENEWLGQNLLGKCLDKVRDSLYM
jgi:hypothetical protein